VQYQQMLTAVQPVVQEKLTTEPSAADWSGWMAYASWDSEWIGVSAPLQGMMVMAAVVDLTIVVDAGVDVLPMTLAGKLTGMQALMWRGL
jgi:hypothetical protein